ncbi:hypothetical protein S7711_08586 [Stachybotrys chartarum IBT 7711]|uniref:Uncharacterized protein n=1 Tax=Stachybotrys chartarum (strain CBS 109288 / IBT 7711) TaxID=1280523 RepID=A0A084AJH5_STACB|nr:hypothetical protein S7711_08586 [Stachybotrys chartarum IBT 7711]KFA53624.1 hypothetical protein S40293_07516 [Stachybotrys chartarum IBT 40293]
MALQTQNLFPENAPIASKALAAPRPPSPAPKDKARVDARPQQPVDPPPHQRLELGHGPGQRTRVGEALVPQLGGQARHPTHGVLQACVGGGGGAVLEVARPQQREVRVDAHVSRALPPLVPARALEAPHVGPRVVRRVPAGRADDRRRVEDLLLGLEVHDGGLYRLPHAVELVVDAVRQPV